MIQLMTIWVLILYESPSSFMTWKWKLSWFIIQMKGTLTGIKS